MKNSYKVLWLDDEFDKLEIIIQKASLKGIIYSGFTNALEGIMELENKYLSYDAVIVDGIFHKKPGQSGDTVNDSAFLDVARALDRLSSRKMMPWFILSGQASFTLGKNAYADGYNKRVYDKNSNDDLDCLWRDIKAEADEQVENQLRSKFKKVFELCTDVYLGGDSTAILMAAIKSVYDNNDSQSTEDAFTAIRKVIEKLFFAFNRLGFLPDEILKENGWLNQSSRFLAGNHSLYVLRGEILPPIISFLLKNILFVTQDASHVQGELKLKVDNHVKQQKTPYLYYSIVFQLLDILVWFKNYADINPDKEINKSVWTRVSESDWQSGVVFNLNPKGYAFFKPENSSTSTYIPQAIVSEHSLSNGDNVSVQVEEYLDMVSQQKKSKVRSLRKINN